jgi:cell division protein FtsL/uncharacterized protein YoxC
MIMTQTETSEQPTTIQPVTPKQRGFFSRFLRALFKTVLALILIAALIVISGFIFQELRRSFNVVSSRIDRQSDQVVDLQSQLNSHSSQIALLQETDVRQDEAIASLNLTLDQNIAHQEEVFTALIGQIEGIIADTQTLSQTITLLGNGQVALQQDVVGHSGELDALGGDVDDLKGNVSTLQANEALMAENLAAFETELAVADPIGMRQAVYTFHVWELVTRAQLRLAQQNFGLAAADIQMAQTTLAVLMESAPPEMGEMLRPVEMRLRLAADSLPDSPETAVNDLDIAWQELDTILTLILGLEPLPEEVPSN